MENVLDVISWGLLICGGVFSIIGGIGTLRLPDVFSRMHAASVTESMGAAAIFIGLMVQAGWTLITVKLVLMLIFMMFTNPTATHAIARAALGEGLTPLTDDDEDDLGDYVLTDTKMMTLETGTPETNDKEPTPSKT